MRQRGCSDKYLDSLWRKAVKLKWNYRSVWSGEKVEHVHHMITKGKKNMRWCVDNGCPLTLVEHKRVHTTPGAAPMLINKFSKDKYEELETLSVQYFDKNFDRIKNELKEIIKKYEKEQK